MPTTTSAASRKSRRVPAPIIVAFAVTGLAGAAVLSFFNTLPIVLASLLGVGFAAFIYGVLGAALPDASAVVEGFKIAGTMGVFLATVLQLNAVFDVQLRERHGAVNAITPESLAGEWRSQWAEGRMLSRLSFTTTETGATFDGYVQQFDDKQWHRLYEFDNGVARIERDGLALTATVRDLSSNPNRTFTLSTPEPLRPGVLFLGEMTVPRSDPHWSAMRDQKWGIALHRQVERP